MNAKILRVDRIASNVSRLSELFTRHRDTLPASYLKDAGLREAYVLYFLPVNMQKIHRPLRDISLHPAGLLEKNSLRILDVGSGPGTAIIGTLDFFGKQRKAPLLEFTAVDPVFENLREAERLFRSFSEQCPAEASMITVKSSIEKMRLVNKSLFDIIILSNVLSEIRYNNPERITKRADTIKKLINKYLAQDGSCIIIEPSLRETSREMLEVRDELLTMGFHIYSPCLMNAPCPALLNPRDWCHEDVPWDPPAMIREIDKITGLRKDSLKFSYAVIRKDPLSIRDIYEGNCYKVVSEPLVSRGKIEHYVCSGRVRRLAVRLDRDRTNMNAPFERLRRGMIISLENIVDEGTRLRVVKTSRIVPLS